MGSSEAVCERSAVWCERSAVRCERSAVRCERFRGGAVRCSAQGRMESGGVEPAARPAAKRKGLRRADDAEGRDARGGKMATARTKGGQLDGDVKENHVAEVKKVSRQKSDKATKPNSVTNCRNAKRQKELEKETGSAATVKRQKQPAKGTSENAVRVTGSKSVSEGRQAVQPDCQVLDTSGGDGEKCGKPANFDKPAANVGKKNSKKVAKQTNLAAPKTGVKPAQTSKKKVGKKDGPKANSNVNTPIEEASKVISEHQAIKNTAKRRKGKSGEASSCKDGPIPATTPEVNGNDVAVDLSTKIKLQDAEDEQSLLHDSATLTNTRSLVAGERRKLDVSVKDEPTHGATNLDGGGSSSRCRSELKTARKVKANDQKSTYRIDGKSTENKGKSRTSTSEPTELDTKSTVRDEKSTDHDGRSTATHDGKSSADHDKVICTERTSKEDGSISGEDSNMTCDSKSTYLVSNGDCSSSSSAVVKSAGRNLGGAMSDIDLDKSGTDGDKSSADGDKSSADGDKSSADGDKSSANVGKSSTDGGKSSADASQLDDDRHFACAHCSYRAKRRVQLRRHLGTHGVHECAHCDFVADSSAKLHAHMQQSHPARCDRKRCMRCGRVVHAAQMAEHANSCTGEIRPWACLQCQREFRYECQLRTHIRTHDPAAAGKSPAGDGDDDDTAVSTAGAATRADVTSGSAPANELVTLAKLANAAAHNASANVPTASAAVTDTANAATAAAAAAATVDAAAPCARTSDGGPPAAVVGVPVERPPVAACSVCARTFATAAQLREHAATHVAATHAATPAAMHTTARSAPFICDIGCCSDTFAKRALLVLHKQQVHGVVRQFACEHPGCGLRFTKRSQLTRHGIVHTDTRNFICEWTGCGKAFRHSDNLRVHFRRHSKEQPICCTLCSYTCHQRISLKSHMETEHGSAGTTAGTAAGTMAGAVAGMTTGAAAGTPAGAVADTPAGTVADTPAGAAAGTPASAADSMTTGTAAMVAGVATATTTTSIIENLTTQLAQLANATSVPVQKDAVSEPVHAETNASEAPAAAEVSAASVITTDVVAAAPTQALAMQEVMSAVSTPDIYEFNDDDDNAKACSLLMRPKLAGRSPGSTSLENSCDGAKSARTDDTVPATVDAIPSQESPHAIGSGKGTEKKGRKNASKEKLQDVETISKKARKKKSPKRSNNETADLSHDMKPSSVPAEDTRNRNNFVVHSQPLGGNKNGLTRKKLRHEHEGTGTLKRLSSEEGRSETPKKCCHENDGDLVETKSADIDAPVGQAVGEMGSETKLKSNSEVSTTECEMTESLAEEQGASEENVKESGTSSMADVAQDLPGASDDEKDVQDDLGNCVAASTVVCEPDVTAALPEYTDEGSHAEPQQMDRESPSDKGFVEDSGQTTEQAVEKSNDSCDKMHSLDDVDRLDSPAMARPEWNLPAGLQEDSVCTEEMKAVCPMDFSKETVDEATEHALQQQLGPDGNTPSSMAVDSALSDNYDGPMLDATESKLLETSVSNIMSEKDVDALSILSIPNGSPNLSVHSDFGADVAMSPGVFKESAELCSTTEPFAISTGDAAAVMQDAMERPASIELPDDAAIFGVGVPVITNVPVEQMTEKTVPFALPDVSKAGGYGGGELYGDVVPQAYGVLDKPPAGLSQEAEVSHHSYPPSNSPYTPYMPAGSMERQTVLTPNPALPAAPEYSPSPSAFPNLSHASQPVYGCSGAMHMAAAAYSSPPHSSFLLDPLAGKAHESLHAIVEPPTYAFGRDVAADFGAGKGLAATGFPADGFPPKDFFSQYFGQDPSTLPLSHLPTQQEQRLAYPQRPAFDMFQRASMLTTPTYAGDSLAAIAPGMVAQGWGLDERMRPAWPQPSPLVAPAVAGQLGRTPFNRPDFGFETAAARSLKHADAFAMTQPTADPYNSMSYMARPFTPAVSYARPPAGSGQKHLEEAYRHADYCGLPSTADLYGRIAVNPTALGLDKYYYQRDAMYRPPFMPPASTPQYTDYARGNPAAYAQHSAAAAAAAAAYGLMDKPYLASAKMTDALPSLPERAAAASDYMQQRPPPADPHMQDPYHRSVIYNMMSRYY